MATPLRYRYQPALGWLLLPSLLLIGIFSYYPAVRSLIGGFYQWDGFSPPTYAGLSQFKQYRHSPNFGTECRNVVILVGGGLPLTPLSPFPPAQVVPHLPQRAASLATYVPILPIVLPPPVLIQP